MNTFSQQSMLSVAYNILDQRNEKMKLNDLIDQVFEELNITDDNSELRTELYLEIMTSGNFVYLGHEEWDIKLKHSLKEYIKDPVEFLSKEELNQSVEDVVDLVEDDDEFDDSDVDEDYRDEDDDDAGYMPREGFGEDSDEDDFDDSDDFDDRESFDEDEYNDYMDEYEYRYDER